jgi:hypothetical protein
VVIETGATQLCSRKEQSVLHPERVGPLHHSNGHRSAVKNGEDSGKGVFQA